MNRALFLTIILAPILALADNSLVPGTEYQVSSTGAYEDEYPEPYTCHAPMPEGFRVRFTGSRRLELRFCQGGRCRWVPQVAGRSTDDGGYYGSWTSRQLSGTPGLGVTVHIWHPAVDEGNVNARLSVSGYDDDGDPCGNAWRFPIVYTSR